MIKWNDMLLSLSLHAVVIGAVTVTGIFCPGPEREPGETLIFFEVVEESVLDAGDGQADSPPAVPAPESPPEAGQLPEPPPDPPRQVQEQAEDVHAVAETAESGLEENADGMHQAVAGAVEMPDAEEEPETDGVQSAEQAPQAPEERSRIVSAPIALNRIAPVYPQSARRKGHEGNVTVEIGVASNGDVVRVEVVGSSGYGELDAAAVSAARSARFAPATEDGVGISGELRLTFEFRLK